MLLANFKGQNFKFENGNFDIHFYEFKLGIRAEQMGRNINKVWSQGTVNERTMQGQFQKYQRAEFVFEGEESRESISAVDDDELKI